MMIYFLEAKDICWLLILLLVLGLVIFLLSSLFKVEPVLKVTLEPPVEVTPVDIKVSSLMSQYKCTDTSILEYILATPDPLLTASIIATESGFDTKAISRCHAVGLMQITPKTAFWIAEQLGFKDFQLSDLFQPSINIAFGSWYYYEHLKLSTNELKLAAYNAGPGTVRKYKGIPPYRETQRYIKKVLKIKEELEAIV
jgi:hypothetical protein